MKVSRAIIKDFEKDQAEYGTEVALHNFMWISLSEQFTDLGVKRLRTSYVTKGKGRK